MAPVNSSHYHHSASEAIGFNERDSFSFISHEFSKYHQDPKNVLLHFITTPLGLVGALSLIRYATNSSSSLVGLCFLYLLSLLPIADLHQGEFYGTFILLVIIVLTCRHLKLGIVSSLACIALGYILQDLSHLGTKDLETFQGSYSGGAGTHISFADFPNWLREFGKHNYYLLPLCIHVALHQLNDMPQGLIKNLSFLTEPIPQDVQEIYKYGWIVTPLIAVCIGGYCLDSKNNLCFFPGAPYFHRMLRCNLVGGKDDPECRQKDLKAVRDWAMAHTPDRSKSSHWWYRDLAGETKAAYDRCARSRKILELFRSLFSEKNYVLEAVEGMNEIYVTGPARLDEGNNSDQVFYTRHVDGPWGLIPFVSVYRCIVGMDRNECITTHFPLANLSVNACEGDVLAFDFNREVHYITQDESKKAISDEFRVVLKLHYCVYPRVLAPLGWFMSWLNTRYNMAFRALFLKTINPVTFYEHFLAWNVNFNTLAFDRLETYLGQRSVVYLAFCAALWYTTGMYQVFFALTSVVHYVRYITTFYIRRGIDFGSFKRDVLLFKTIALIQLFYHYFFPANGKFEIHWVSIAMIVSGYIVSVMATNAIGIDRTYFAAELGLVPPKWIEQFPYGYIPHPMIVSQMWALLGLHMAPHFRNNWPYVVPVHCGLYLVHMLQEHFDIYRRYPDDVVVTNANLVKPKKVKST